MTQPLEWDSLSAFSLKAVDEDGGRWIISGPLREGDVAEIKYQAPFPEGEDHASARVKLGAMGEEWLDLEEGQRLWSYCAPQELGYAQNHFEAQQLVEMLRTGDAELPTAEEIITQNGFEFRHEFDNWRGHFKCYRHKKKTALGLIIGTDGIDLKYDRRNGWHNLMSLLGDHLNDHIRKTLIRTYYPASVSDYQRIGAAFAVWLLDERTKRGGRNFGGRPLLAA